MGLTWDSVLAWVHGDPKPSHPPRRSSDPRPGGVPYYIANKCDTCGGPLTLNPDHGGFLDEFICPACKNGIYMDWPKGQATRIGGRREQP